MKRLENLFRGWLLGLLAAHPFASTAQPGTTTVLPWKANTTLNTYLVQQLHQQYAPRQRELIQATATAAGTLAYRDSVRARFRRVLGPLPAPRTPLRAQVTGTLQRPGFRIEKVIFESTPHHHVTANLYVPAGKGQWPAVLLPCGHEAEGKATVSYQQTAMLFATHGFVVLVPDPVSQGERMQLTDASGKPLTRGGTTEHTLLNAQANLLGRTLAAAELWDNVRGLDYLVSRPEVDTARLGCLGNSGGATQTAYLMAYDPRLKAAALCSYVAAGERNLELTGPADGCVMLPGAGAARLDIGDWLIAFAPRPLLVLAGTYDFVDYPSIRTAFSEVWESYKVLDQLEKPAIVDFDDGHGISQPKREMAVWWFRRWFFRGERPFKDAGIREASLPISASKELQCTTTGQVNTAFKDEGNIIAFYWREARQLVLARPASSPALLTGMVRQQLGAVGGVSRETRNARAAPPRGPCDNLRDRYYYKSPVDVERRDTVRRAGLAFEKLILRRGLEPPLPVLLLRPTGATAPSRVSICFADKGKSALADSTAWLNSLLATRAVVLLVDLRGQGETADPNAAIEPKYYNREYRPALLGLHLGRPLLAQRVQDVCTMVSFAFEEAENVPVEVYAIGPGSALVALHTAVIMPDICQVRLCSLPASYQSLLAQPTARDTYSGMLPGVLQHYDLPDLVRALGKRLVVSP